MTPEVAMPKFCAAKPLDICICSFLDQFASEPFIFFAEILGIDHAKPVG